MQLNFNDIVGTKVQHIFESFKTAILSGSLKPGQKLVSIKELSEMNGISKDTTERAYKKLREAGYIISFPGNGNYVSEKAIDKMSVLVLCADHSYVAKSPLISAINGIARITLKKVPEESISKTLSDEMDNYDGVIILLDWENKDPMVP